MAAGPIKHRHIGPARQLVKNRMADDAGSDKPAGWFEAQQNAEAAKRDEDKSDDENA